MSSIDGALNNPTDEEAVAFGAMRAITVCDHYKAFGRWSYSEARKILPIGTLKMPEFDLGKLAKLPAEILTMVVGEMDLDTLFSFYHVNRMGRDVLGNSPVVQAVFNTAPTCVRGVLARGLGNIYTINDLYRLLTGTKDCEGVPNEQRPKCSKVGRCLHLVLKRRLCDDCMRYGSIHQTDTFLWRKTAVDQVIATHYPDKVEAYNNHLRNIPIVRISRSGLDGKVMKRVLARYLYIPTVENIMGISILDHLNAPEMEDKMGCTNIDIGAVTIPLPYLRRGNVVQLSLRCLGCPKSNLWFVRPTSPHIMDQDRFLEHFRSCSAAQRVVRSRMEDPVGWRKALQGSFRYIPDAASLELVLQDRRLVERQPPQAAKRYNLRKKKLLMSYRERGDSEDE